MDAAARHCLAMRITSKLKQKQVGPGNPVEPPFDQNNQTCAYDSDALDIHLQQLYSDRAALLHILQMPCAFRSEPPLLSTSKRNLAPTFTKQAACMDSLQRSTPPPFWPS